MKTNLLRSKAVGTLTGLALFGPLTLQAVDVSEYGVLKGKAYSQYDASTPGDDWVFYTLTAYVWMTSAGTVTAATAQPPGQESLMLFETDDPKLLQFDFPAGLTLPDFNLVFPNGDYLVAMTTAHDGTRNVTLSLTGDSYPNTPTFQNFATLETIDPSAAFTLSWSSFSGGTANDLIQVRIVDGDNNEVFKTPALGVSGALNGTAASVAIPANTLAAESYFTARLTFLKVVTRNTSGYTGATGVAGYYKSTEVSLTTTVGSGGSDTTPPELVASSPLNGASGVAVNSSVVFIFDEPMAASQAIAWSANVNAANFACSWSGAGTTLTCTYAGSLPSAATITWVLNPSGQPQNFEDVAGNPLPADTYAGSFSTATSTNGCGGADTGRGYGGVSKEVNYVQTSAAAPTPHPTRAATFLGSVTSPTNNPVTAAQLQVPGGPLLTLTNFMGLGFSFLHTEVYAAQGTLDTARPGGHYNLEVTRTTGSPANANISVTSSYPPTPQIQNYAACQAVNPAADFTVQWNGFTGAGANDAVGFSIVHPTSGWYWVTPDPCVPRELPNTATSVTIPAGTLASGTTYDASLIYSRATDSLSNAIPDIDVAAWLRKTVNFTLTTTGGGGGGAQFIGWRMLVNGSLELQLQGTVGQSYWIEVSNNLVSGWLPMSLQMIPAGGVATFQMAVGNEPQFIRAREQ